MSLFSLNHCGLPNFACYCRSRAWIKKEGEGKLMTTSTVKLSHISRAKEVLYFYSVVVGTLDFESNDLGSTPGRTLI